MFQGGPPLLVELKADYYDVSALVETAVNTLDRFRVNYCIESFHPVWSAGCASTARTYAGASSPRISGGSGGNCPGGRPLRWRVCCPMH